MSPAVELAGSGEGLRRFRRSVAARGDERVAVSDVQMRQSLPLRGASPDLLSLRERREQRLRLGNLGHFRRRRKAFERGREDGVGFGQAAGRVIELSERKHRAQPEAARLLLLCDFDGTQERFFGGCRIRRIALEQQFAARSVQFRVECAMPGPFGRRQRFAEDGEGSVHVARTGFGFGEGNLDEPVPDQFVLLAHEFSAAPHALEPAGWRAAFSIRQALEKNRVVAPSR